MNQEVSVELRRVTVDDAARLAAFHRRNREFMRPYEPERPAEFFEADALAGRIQRSQELLGDRLVDWLVEHDGELVGKLTLSNIARGGFQSANIGYAVDEAWNGRGIATAAVGLALRHAFGPLGLHRVEAGTLVGNVASMRVLEKNGFVRIGLSPYHLNIAGAWRDHVLFACTAEMLGAT